MFKPVRIYSIGHGARPLDAFLATLASAGVTTLADVRSFPGSRRHPHFGKEALAAARPAHGLAYHWLPELGGRRRQRLDPSPNPAWQVLAFRNYADHLDTPEFHAGLAKLLALAAHAPTAFMCAETHWSQCHRRILSDKLWTLRWDVIHLITPERHEPHHPPPFLRVDGDRLRYDLGIEPDGQVRLL